MENQSEEKIESIMERGRERREGGRGCRDGLRGTIHERLTQVIINRYNVHTWTDCHCQLCSQSGICR